MSFDDFFNSNCTDDFDDDCSTDPWSDLDGPTQLGPPQLAALVCYGLVFLLGAPGNAVVAWVTAFRMPRSVNSQWFRHLALADLLCCLSLPLLMVPLAQDQHWPYGQVGCKLLPAVFNLTMYCSVLLLVVISLDRWLLVTRPVWCQNRRTPRHARWVCLGAWALALVLSLPHVFYMQKVSMGSEKVVCSPSLSRQASLVVNIVQFLLGFLLPFLIIVACHWVVYARTAQGPSRGRGGGARSRRTRRVIGAVVVSFFLCWLPLHVTDFLLRVTPHEKPWISSLRLAGVLTLCLAYFNSCLNPLLYVCLGRSFKDSMRQSFRGMLSFMAEEPSRSGPSFSVTKSTSDNIQEKTM
ncbi:C5a anaphylatoxin chemotactic receptor 1 [Anguilla rostrata]|uniref:C5a anaphylatoxin chemotactic receptor 1 n=1 Tax=Anguilla rostrata TaxID=7938 RepID=UPI0030D56A22